MTTDTKITNQALLQKLKDPKFYLENFCKIKTKDRKFIKFKLNEAQKDLFNALNKFFRIIILKARQIGFSTAVCGFFYHDTIMVPGTTSVIIGYNREMTTELLEKIKLFYKTTPEELRPTIHFNSKYEMSFPKLDSKIVVLPSNETVGRGYTINNLLCVSGETEVFIKNGDIKKVVDLQSDDLIMNGSGGYSPVKYLIRKKPTSKTLSIKAVGVPHLRVTFDHKILTREFKTGKPSWKKASDLSVGDYLAYPWFQIRSNFKKLVIPHIANAVRHENEIKLDYNFGCLIGWYLAEGTIFKNRNRVTFSLDRDEVEDFLRLSKGFEKYVGKISVLKSKTSRTVTVNFYGKDFATFIDSYFGRTDSKTLPDRAWYWGTDFMYGVLEGVFKGDGYLKNPSRVQLTNTNIKIINQVKKALVSLRFGFPTINVVEQKKEWKTRYDLFLSGPGNYKFRKKYGLALPQYTDKRSLWKKENLPNANLGAHSWRRGKEYYWTKIRFIQELPKEDWVYDVVLSKSPHSFTTVSGVVHNCTELSLWEKQEEKMATLEASVPIDGRIVIESTPRGVGNLYHEMWVTDDNGYEKKEYGWWWNYTEEQIELIKKRMNDPQLFAQEYGLEFLASGRMVFDKGAVVRQRKNILRIGDVIEYQNENGETKIHRVEEWDGLRIYKPVKNDGLYVAGVDTSEGVEGGDYTVVTIFDRKTGEEAAMYRGMIQPDLLAQKLNDWGRKYNTALMAVEINNHGITTVNELKKMQYPNIYRRPAKFDTAAEPFSEKMGWKTTLVTKPFMMDDINKALRDDLIMIHSKETLDEMLTYVYNENGYMEPMSKKYKDDCIISTAVAFQAFKVLYDKPLDQLDYSKFLPRQGY